MRSFIVTVRIAAKNISMTSLEWHDCLLSIVDSVNTMWWRHVLFWSIKEIDDSQLLIHSWNHCSLSINKCSEILIKNELRQK